MIDSKNLNLSYSQVALFNSCKLRHFFKYFLRVSQKEEKFNKYKYFGILFHDVLSGLSEVFINDNNGIVDLDLFDSIIDQEISYRASRVDRQFKISHPLEKYRLIVKLGLRSLFNDIKKRNMSISGTEVRFSVKMKSGHVWNGFYDLVLRDQEEGVKIIGEVKTVGFKASLSPLLFMMRSKQISVYRYIESLIYPDDCFEKVALFRVFRPEEVNKYGMSLDWGTSDELIQSHFSSGNGFLSKVVSISPLDGDRFTSNAEEEMSKFYSDPIVSFLNEPTLEIGKCYDCEFLGFCHKKASFSEFNVRQKTNKPELTHDLS